MVASAALQACVQTTRVNESKGMNNWIYFKIIMGTKSVVIQLSKRVLPAGAFHCRVKYVGGCRGSNDPTNLSAFPENCTKVCWEHYTLRLSYNTYKVLSTQREYNSKQLTSLDSEALAPPVQIARFPFPCSSHDTRFAHYRRAQIENTENNTYGTSQQKAKWLKKTCLFLLVRISYILEEK